MSTPGQPGGPFSPEIEAMELQDLAGELGVDLRPLWREVFRLDEDEQ